MFYYTASPGVEREIQYKGALLPACLKSTEERREHGPEGPFFSHLLPLPPVDSFGQGLREMGTRSTQLLAAAEGDRPYSVSHGIPELCSQNIAEFPPELLVRASPFPLSHRPFHVSALLLGLSEVKKDGAKGKSPRLRRSTFRLTRLERQRASSVCVQNSS